MRPNELKRKEPPTANVKFSYIIKEEPRLYHGSDSQSEHGQNKHVSRKFKRLDSGEPGCWVTGDTRRQPGHLAISRCLFVVLLTSTSMSLWFYCNDFFGR